MTERIPSLLSRWLPAGLGLLLFLAAGLAKATGVEIGSATLAPGDEAYALSVDADIALNPTLEDVVARGVPLYILAEFELTRSRWYWFDEKIAARTLSFRLSYHALTRQYRLSTGALHQNFASLGDAVRVMSRIRDWPVADKALLKAGEAYQAAFRIRLDFAQLPKPIQVSALGSAEWNLASDWLRWTYTVPEREAK